MKVKDIPELKQRILDTLPIKQSELWKMLKIDHRDASEIVGIMVKENLIKKTKIDHTFMLESPNGDENKKEKDLSPLISGSGKFSPCSGCPDECSPAECKKLTEWILDNKEMKKEKDKNGELEEEEKVEKIEDVEDIKKEKDENGKLEEEEKVEKIEDEKIEDVEDIKKEKDENGKLEEEEKVEKVEEEKDKKKKKSKNLRKSERNKNLGKSERNKNLGKSERNKNLGKSERAEMLVL